MNIGKLLLAVTLGTLAFSAQARLDCSELKSQIDAKLQAKGVKDYSLDVVGTADAGSAKVVGTCDGGASSIVYARAGAGASSGASAEPAAPAAPKPVAPAKKKPSSVPPIGNY